MKNKFLVIALTLAITAVIALMGSAPVAQASSPANCNGGAISTGSTSRPYCVTDDPLPSAGRAAAPAAIVPPITTAPNPVICDGDGTTGYRVQVVYVYITGNANQYNTYLTSFQEWAHQVDQAMVDSAAATGGVRHVRFVHDAKCFPVVAQVAVSSAAGSNFNQMISELSAKGYNRTDRDYLLFFDAQTYCGISTVLTDDSAGQTNWNNSGPSYARIDNACWASTSYGPTIPTHELGHTLGAVQPTAPHHSATNYHCNDGYDVMCDFGFPRDASFSDTVCPAISFLRLYDCNHDDYFHTNPPAGSYLATHWNIANNQFLIYANQTAVRVDSVVTGKLNGSVFMATDSFNAGDAVTVRVHIADTNGANVSGATASFTVNQPNGSAFCSFANKTTDSTGTAQGTCALTAGAPSGTWSGKISSFARASTPATVTDSVTQHNFSVQTAPTAVTLSSFTAQSGTLADNPLVLGGSLVAACLGIFVTLGARKRIA